MTYPIEITTVHLEYKDRDTRSDKFYAMMLVKVQDGRTALVQRWGKNGSIGQMKIGHFQNFMTAEKEFEKVFRQKSGKGYSTVSQKEHTAADLAEFKKLCGPALWPKLPASFFKETGIEFDGADKRKELADPTIDPVTGKWIGEKPPKTIPEEELRRIKAAEKEKAEREAAAVYEENPLFGAF